ncbi:LOW QUALITY PROTEIN: hypothetical protein ACHAXA_011897 [Cyclostephanos tholiformis]|uniref:PDZ domain-containing protein n=1 Tax=Cyclostephanos tholiformis TaxID=382380 RepID=A0ABD3SC85_9STRA
MLSHTTQNHCHVLQFDSARKSIFSASLADFLTKVFMEQQVYDLRIIGANIFDDHILQNGQYVEGSSVENQVKDDGETIVSFSMVISAEYTSEYQMDTISSATFRKMLVHVCDKFQSHLLKHLQDKTGDSYFMYVRSIVLEEPERVEENSGQKGSHVAIEKQTSVDNSKKVASIIAIVVGGTLFIVLSFAAVKFHRKEKELKAARWRSKEMGSLNSFSKNSSSAAVDDYSSHPLSDTYGYNTIIYRNNIEDLKREDRNEEEVLFGMDNPYITNSTDADIALSSVWPGLAAHRTIFPAPAAVAAPMSYTEELRTLPRQHVFAPPGKIGVAIDVLNGQPVVHKVRKGSPLEKMLQPNDIILAIDDEDMSCMSAADVTNKMVRRMDRVRKITFARRPLEL